MRRHPLTGAWRSPAEATARRVLACVDPDALDRAIGAWLAGQQPPPPPARPLLEGLDFADTVVTADALHTQREHADWLVTAKHAAYLLMVKANQPTLHHQLRRLRWGDIEAWTLSSVRRV